MDDITITIGLDDLEGIDENKLFQILSDAVEESLEIARDSLAAGARSHNLADYIASRPIIMTDDFHGMIILDDSRAESMLAAQERGSPAWDMKPYLLGSPKAKINKKTGEPYIIVPFHGQYGYNPLNPSASKYAYAYAQAAADKTFRTVTPKSGGWIYPATSPDPIFEAAQAEANEYLVDMVDEIMGED